MILTLTLTVFIFGIERIRLGLSPVEGQGQHTLGHAQHGVHLNTKPKRGAVFGGRAEPARGENARTPPQQDKTRRAKTRQDKTRQDKARQGKTRQGKARRGKAGARKAGHRAQTVNESLPAHSEPRVLTEVGRLAARMPPPAAANQAATEVWINTTWPNNGE